MDRKRRPATKVLLATILVVYGLLALHSEYWLGIVTTHPIGDDFKIYYGAYFKALAGENPYEPYGIGSGFIYHPAALTFVSLFSWSHDQWFSTYLWIAASALAWGGCIWLALQLARPVWTETQSGQADPMRTGFTLALLIGFAPVWETLHIGQNNTFVVLCLLLTLYFVRQEKPFAAGLSLACASLLKTSPLVLLGYLAVTQRFRALGWTLVCLLGISTVALVQFSPAVFEQFWAMLPRLGTEIHPDTYNQSLISVVYQTFPVLGELGLDDTLVLAYRAASALLIGALLLIGFLNYRRTRNVSLWLYMALTITLVYFSPLVWYHHSSLLLLPLTALLMSPNKLVLMTGTGMMVGLQAERLFEQLITRTAYPVVMIHLALLVIVVGLYAWDSRARATPQNSQPGGL